MTKKLTHQQKLSAIREWVLEACPDWYIKFDQTVKLKMTIKNGEQWTVEDLDLPEVLRAINELPERVDLVIHPNGWFMMPISDPRKSIKWNLLLPLDGQSPETIAFLFSLLP